MTAVARLLILLLFLPARGDAGPIPSGQPRDDDLTAIAALVCSAGQIMKMSAGAWVCSADAGVGGSGEPSDGNKTEITVAGGTIWTINANAVTNAKLADVATGTIKGRVTAATGDPEDLTATQVATLLDSQIATQAELAAAVATLQPLDADLTTLAGKTVAGTGTHVRLSTGSFAAEDCVKVDASGNFVTTGATCGTGSGEECGPLNNTAAVPPTVTDDSGDGYAVFSRWYDTATAILYVATDVTPGAAAWVRDDDTDTDTDTGVLNLQGAYQGGKTMVGADSEANAVVICTDRSDPQDGDCLDAEDMGWKFWAEPTSGPQLKAFPDGDYNITAPNTYDISFRLHNGTNAIAVARFDDTTGKLTYLNQGQPTKSVGVSGYEFGACTYAEANVGAVATKPKNGVFTCTSATTDGFDFDFVTPLNWNAGTVKVKLSAYNVAGTPAGNVVLGCSGRAVSDGEAIPDRSVANKQNLTLTFGTQYAEETAETAAITINDSPTAGDHIYMHCDIQSATTTMANVRILAGAKVSYTVTSESE